jgi:protein involved in polysaccharide export with SLBB domain
MEVSALARPWLHAIIITAALLTQSPVLASGGDDALYRIGPGDQLTVRFLVNPDMDAQVIVGPDGQGVFPLISSVPVAGMTIPQVNATLEQAYGQVLRNPQMETLVSQYNAAQVFVGGEVREPGAYPLKGNVNASRAVMIAGGLLPTAGTGKVIVIHQAGQDERPIMRVVDLKLALQQADLGRDPPIQAGDLIFVPRSSIAEADLFVQQHITNLVPFGTSVGYTINSGTIK